MRQTTASDLQELMDAFLEAVSFEPPEAPDYGRIRELFILGGLLIRNSGEAPEVTGVEAFIAPRQELFDSGTLTAFYEGELSAVTEDFGGVAHRFSTYEKRGTVDGTTSLAMGIITTQFVRTPEGWRMSVMAWDDTSPGQEIPARYKPAIAVAGRS